MAAGDAVQRLVILGSTGSIGTQTLDVVTHLNALHARGAYARRTEVVGLAAGSNAATLLEQAGRFGVADLALADDRNRVDAPAGVRLRRGADAAEALVREVGADLVLSSMVGACGLPATLAAIERGTDIALANKETLVAAGRVIVDACARTGSRLLPVDSEHSGLWQCLASRSSGHAAPPFEVDGEVSRVILTASGGALRDLPKERIHDATPELALAHPTWSMGAKVTIDSASLTNKALELIEAHWLFGVDADRLGALVHPASIVHALVEFADGSTLAQLGAPDMRTPIQVAVAHPHRVEGRAASLDWGSLRSLAFEAPDLERFPALELGFRVIREGGTAGAIFNAANERAVEAFLDHRIPFGEIHRLTEAALSQVGVSPIGSLADALSADAAARRCVDELLGQPAA
jgi:1-deoxy-D-xylulose-5-phosphate reductoisomerase